MQHGLLPPAFRLLSAPSWHTGIRELALPASSAGRPRCPGGNRVRGEPERHVASLDERALVLRPVRDVVLRLVLGMHSRFHAEIVLFRPSERPTISTAHAGGAAFTHQRLYEQGGRNPPSWNDPGTVDPRFQYAAITRWQPTVQFWDQRRVEESGDLAHLERYQRVGRPSWTSARHGGSAPFGRRTTSSLRRLMTSMLFDRAPNQETRSTNNPRRMVRRDQAGHRRRQKDEAVWIVDGATDHRQQPVPSGSAGVHEVPGVGLPGRKTAA